MEKKKLCNIIKDLLPSYIENLTNEETNSFIESHIADCSECKELLKNMQKEIEVNSPKKEEKNFKYIKRYSQKLKIFRNILLIIALIFILIGSRRFIIITDLSNKAKVAESKTNYYIKLECYLDRKFITYEKYNKDKISLVIKKIYYIDNPNNVEEYINYKSDKEDLKLVKNTKQQELLTSDKNMHLDITNYTLNFYAPFKKLYCALTTNIQNVTLSGKKCYLLKINNTERFIDAETGLIIKYIDNDKNKVTDCHYEFDTVTDEDVELPDTTGFVPID